MKNQNTEPDRKVVVYARQAAQNEEAMAQQIDAAQKLAAAHGFTDCEVISESGSGLKIRPKLRELLGRVDAGEISTIVAVTPDRVTRHPKRFQEVVARLSAAGTSLLVE